MNSRVTVTGAAGYLGSVLCQHLLQAGHSVLAVDNLAYGQQSLNHFCADPNFDFRRGDVRDEDLMREVIRDADVVIPLAAVVGAPACDEDPWGARDLNLHAIQLINRLRSPDQLVILPNTNSGYGAGTGVMHCTEETPLEPISLYGQTKVQAERAVLEFPKTISLRLATVFGMSPRMRIDLLVNHFVYAAVTNGDICIYEKDFKRNYVHIRDVADCIVHCIENADAMAGRPYNLGLNEANISKDELARKVKEYVPSFYFHFAKVGSDPDKRNYIVSNDRLAKAGFTAKRTIDDGIVELLKGYRAMPRARMKNISEVRAA